MSAQVFVVIASLAAYMMVIVVIGLYSARLSRWTMEDYHMGSREFRVFVLFSAVFGANISAVALIGVPGSAYHLGWIMWPYFVTAWAWLTPLLFYVIGSRSWVLGRKLGYMTVGEVIGNRWRSPGLAVLISAVLIVYTVPYLMTGLLAGGRILEALTDGFFPLWIGEVVVALVVVVYLLLGGMRGAGVGEYLSDKHIHDRRRSYLSDAGFRSGWSRPGDPTRAGGLPRADYSLQHAVEAVLQLRSNRGPLPCALSSSVHAAPYGPQSESPEADDGDLSGACAVRRLSDGNGGHVGPCRDSRARWGRVRRHTAVVTRAIYPHLDDGHSRRGCLRGNHVDDGFSAIERNDDDHPRSAIPDRGSEQVGAGNGPNQSRARYLADGRCLRSCLLQSPGNHSDRGIRLRRIRLPAGAHHRRALLEALHQASGRVVDRRFRASVDSPSRSAGYPQSWPSASCRVCPLSWSGF